MTRYGKLVVELGPMFSSKTTTLLRTASIWQWLGYKFLLVKPALDDRYASDEIVSHDGRRLPCLSVRELPLVSADHDHVLIDEVQFFGAEIIPWIGDLLDRGIHVQAAGLDMDWRGEAFPVSGALAGMADTVHKLTADCAVCGNSASKTFKYDQGGAQIELGSSDKYEPRCNTHWKRPAILPKM